MKYILIFIFIVSCKGLIEPPRPEGIEKSIIVWKIPMRYFDSMLFRGNIIDDEAKEWINLIVVIEKLDTIRIAFNMDNYHKGAFYSFKVPFVKYDVTGLYEAEYEFWLEYK